MALRSYMPKMDDLETKLRPSLLPSAKSAVERARPWIPNARDLAPFNVKEKRLDATIWANNGDHQKGSHFPLCVFTHNKGRRSPEAQERRQQKRNQNQNWQWQRRQPASSANPNNPQWWTESWHPNVGAACADPAASVSPPGLNAVHNPGSCQSSSYEASPGTTSEQPGQASGWSHPSAPEWTTSVTYTWGGGYDWEGGWYPSRASVHWDGPFSQWQRQGW